MARKNQFRRLDNPPPQTLEEFLERLDGDHYAISDHPELAAHMLHATRGVLWQIVMPDGEKALAIQIPRKK